MPHGILQHAAEYRSCAKTTLGGCLHYFCHLPRGIMLHSATRFGVNAPLHEMRDIPVGIYQLVVRNFMDQLGRVIGANAAPLKIANSLQKLYGFPDPECILFLSIKWMNKYR